MALRMWMYDLAREQSPTIDHLRTICRVSVESGYNAIGIYVEHRFRYASAPWAAGEGALEPSVVQKLQTEFPDLQLVPFINILGHFEGFLYAEGGQIYAEQPFEGMQACPSKPEFVQLAKHLIDDVIDAFSSEIIHIGGDETWQLGKCPVCKGKVETWERNEGVDGKARLYGEHFGPMARHVLDKGRRPAVWGDMFLEHPQALECMPKETLIFDWQYFGSCLESSTKFIEKGYEVVPSPSIQVYDAAWCHLLPSEQNVRQIAREARDLNAAGVCVTTWECGLFGAYDSIFPALRASGKLLSGNSEARTLPEPKDFTPEPITDGGKPLILEFDPADSIFLHEYSVEDERYEVWARLMGVELNHAGKIFAYTGLRSPLKVRLLLQGNPFLLWLHHGEELSGEAGDRAIEIVEQALKVAPNQAAKGISFFVRSAIEFARIAEGARSDYGRGCPEQAISKLTLTRGIFDDLGKVAKQTHERIGGSLADIERCRVAKDYVDKVIARIRSYGDGQLGYVPSFEHLTAHSFMPQDQAAWWLINKWAR